MGLRDTFRQAAVDIVTAFGDVAVSTNYLQYSSTSYNASAGTQVVTFATTAGVSVVFDIFTLAEIDNLAVHPEDKQAMIPARNISAITPSVNDRIVQDASVTWEVINVQTDPADALWTLQIRKP